MVDEKAPPPVYMSPPNQQSYSGSPSHQAPQQAYQSPPAGTPPQGQGQIYFSGPQSQGLGPMGPTDGYSAGYPPAQPMMAGPSQGVQYQQRLLDMCAQGNHDVVTKYGVAGIIAAIVLFPCGLFALIIDRERRCARCGVRLG